MELYQILTELKNADNTLSANEKNKITKKVLFNQKSIIDDLISNIDETKQTGLEIKRGYEKIQYLMDTSLNYFLGNAEIEIDSKEKEDYSKKVKESIVKNVEQLIANEEVTTGMHSVNIKVALMRVKFMLEADDKNNSSKLTAIKQ